MTLRWQTNAKNSTSIFQTPTHCSKKSEDEHRNAVRYDDGKPELRLATPTEDEHSDEYLDAIEDDKGKPTPEVATTIVQTPT
jgi:hypothetical protein